ncbi:MAG: carbohydrate ABC transporter permease [Spirochaetia bacterium]|jgi:multiple sugar transport system permease protein
MSERRIEDIRHRRKWHIWLVLIVALIATLFPIFWMLLTSVKSSTDITTATPVWIFKPTLEHYKSVLIQESETQNFESGQQSIVGIQTFDFYKYLINSLVISISTTVLAMVIAYPAAYSLARYRTLGNNYSFWVLSIRMLPPVIFLIPISILFALYNLSDTRLGLVIAYLTFNIPFACWIIKSFIEDIPMDLEKAGYMDGYSRFQVMTRIVFPLTRSAVAAVMIICFIFSWNEFLFAMVISFIKATPLTAGVGLFVTGYGIRWGRISAAAVIAIIPTVVVGLIGQRYLVRGLTMGAVK